MKNIIFGIVVMAVVAIIALVGDAQAQVAGCDVKDCASVPEPMSLLLLGSGAMGLGYFVNKIRK